MDTTSITAAEVRERMRTRGLRQGDLAREAGMPQASVSQLLAGNTTLGPLRERKLARGILRLGLHRPDVPPATPVVIHLGEAASGASE